MNAEVQSEIERLMNESNVEYEKENFTTSIELLIDAWNLLPDPKTNEEESFFITKYIIETYLQIGKPQESVKWIEVFYECDKERNDIGDRKYIAGKVFFALGDINKAKALFIKANELTEGRCFEATDEKYKKLL